MELFEGVVTAIILAATPLMLAALGELVVERSGVLNLGVEGMMIMGAVTGFVVSFESGSLVWGILAAIVAGMAMAALFAAATLWLVANQVASGLALTILGLGLSGLIGSPYAGRAGLLLPSLDLGPLTDIPVLGPIVFGQNVIVYIAFALLILVWIVLFRTRAGLVLRAVGENHDSAHALGYPVRLVRLYAVLFGGGCAGLAGAFLSIARTPAWKNDMTAGRGWIALALVVFASWLPGRLAIGAYLFGGVSIIGLYTQGAAPGSLLAFASGVPSQVMTALPYLATIIVLVLISGTRRIKRNSTPGSLGQPFVPDR